MHISDCKNFHILRSENSSWVKHIPIIYQTYIPHNWVRQAAPFHAAPPHFPHNIHPQRNVIQPLFSTYILVRRSTALLYHIPTFYKKVSALSFCRALLSAPRKPQPHRHPSPLPNASKSDTRRSNIL